MIVSRNIIRHVRIVARVRKFWFEIIIECVYWFTKCLLQHLYGRKNVHLLVLPLLLRRSLKLKSKFVHKLVVKSLFEAGISAIDSSHVHHPLDFFSSQTRLIKVVSWAHFDFISFTIHSPDHSFSGVIELMILSKSRKRVMVQNANRSHTFSWTAAAVGFHCSKRS